MSSAREHRSNACTELVEMEVLDRIRDLRAAARQEGSIAAAEAHPVRPRGPTGIVRRVRRVGPGLLAGLFARVRAHAGSRGEPPGAQ